jgi:hypothetical protein
MDRYNVRKMNWSLQTPLAWEERRMPMAPDYTGLFHRLNNQLGIILANAELLEAKCVDEASRARASQVVSSAIEAMTTARELRAFVEAQREEAAGS